MLLGWNFLPLLIFVKASSPLGESEAILNISPEEELRLRLEAMVLEYRARYEPEPNERDYETASARPTHTSFSIDDLLSGRPATVLMKSAQNSLRSHYGSLASNWVIAHSSSIGNAIEAANNLWVTHEGPKLVQVLRSDWVETDGCEGLTSITISSLFVLVNSLIKSFAYEAIHPLVVQYELETICIKHQAIIESLMKQSKAAILDSHQKGSLDRHTAHRFFGQYLDVICPKPFGNELIYKQSVLAQRIQEESDERVDQKRLRVSDPRLHLLVHRTSVLDDSERIFQDLPSSRFIHGVKIEFVDEYGLDVGGVSRDWFSEVSHQLLAVDDLFDQTQDGLHVLSQSAAAGFADRISLLRFIGRLIGLSLVEQVPLGIVLPVRYCAVLLRSSLRLSDVLEEDSDLYHSMKRTLELTSEELNGVLMDVNDYDYESPEGFITVTFLEDVQLTVENRESFIGKYIQQIDQNTAYALSLMRRGFEDVISPNLLLNTPIGYGESIKLLSPLDLKQWIAGEPRIDPLELVQNTLVVEPYTLDTPVIQWLVQIVTEEMSQLQLQQLLRFTTGLSRTPKGGFLMLGNGWQVVKLDRHKPDGSLPTARTCVYRLELPEYSSKDILFQKLLYAVEHGTTLELS